MKIKSHFFSGLVLFALLYPFFGIKSIIVPFLSVIIDVDHVFGVLMKNRKFSLKRFLFYIRNDHYQVLHVFHTIEFVILCGILSFFSDVFILIFITVLIHFIMDYFDWFIWFSFYSKRIPSLILLPIIYKKSNFYKKMIKRYGGKCTICSFDKAFDLHFVQKDKVVLLCPNHHYWFIGILI